MYNHRKNAGWEKALELANAFLFWPIYSPFMLLRTTCKGALCRGDFTLREDEEREKGMEAYHFFNFFEALCEALPQV